VLADYADATGAPGLADGRRAKAVRAALYAPDALRDAAAAAMLHGRAAAYAAGFTEAPAGRHTAPALRAAALLLRSVADRERAADALDLAVAADETAALAAALDAAAETAPTPPPAADDDDGDDDDAPAAEAADIAAGARPPPPS